MIRAALAALAVAMLASCNVNDYCINCETGDGGHGDAMLDAAPDAAIDASTCVPTGDEVCNGKDDDCDGKIDEEVPGDGDACANQVGECLGGVQHCTMGKLACDKPPTPELCDGLDNNCNGDIDEGDPGGGGQCGTNAGECSTGVNHCNLATHVVECIGAIGGHDELCNGKDDDCDGNFDEGIAAGAACGGAPGADPNVGNCKAGAQMCMGGGTICVGAQGPLFEACDGMDNDCDGKTDEDYDLKTDPQNCGACGNVCHADHALSGCAPTAMHPEGECKIASCQSGYHDNNGDVGDGCEYGSCNPDGAEVCDGIDNDCDGTADNGLTPPPNLCKTVGACTGSTAICTGAGGWKCVYGADAQVDASGNLVAETRCDGLDNDCDGNVDENQPNLEQACQDNKLGACQSTGKFVCDTSDVAGTPSSLDGPAVCDFSHPGRTAPADHEDCNGIDDDCDGIVDNTTGPHHVVDAMTHVMFTTGSGPTMVTHDFYIDTYESSRPDATAALPGILTSRACSNDDVIPWGNISWDSASAACVAAGKTLCTRAQWTDACELAAGSTYPYGGMFAPDACNTESHDSVAGGTDDDSLIATGALATCAIGTQGPFDLSGNLREWTDDMTGTTGGKNIEVLRGGSYLTPAVGATCEFRTSRATQNVIEAENGFRCCRPDAP